MKVADKTKYWHGASVNNSKHMAYNFILWEGILRQPELDHLVLCECEAVVRVKQFVLRKDWLKYWEAATGGVL